MLSLGEAFFDMPLHSFDDLPQPGDLPLLALARPPELRAKLAALLRGRNMACRSTAALEIIVTAGSKIAIHMALMAILDPGDEVLILEPAWVSYFEQVRLCPRCAGLGSL